jgi:hypothetical protein
VRCILPPQARQEREIEDDQSTFSFIFTPYYIYTYTQYIWHPCECPGSIVGKQCADQIEHLAKLSHDTGHHTAAEANLLRHLLGVTKSDSLVDVSCQLVDLAVELCNA